YLGLPLITKRLSKADCNPLIERIASRVNSWVCKALSFAGRLQLVIATLFSMQTYWCSTLLLPMSTIKDCESIFRKFLWGGHGRGKVRWAEVCKPLNEGGLGIKDLKMWNKALILKQIWSVLMDQSLWAKWCHAYLLQKFNFWTAPTTGLLSWSWRQILMLRPLAKEHIIYSCGNGERFSLWYDPWLHGESVHALYGHRVIYDTGLDKLARVKSMIREGEWCWPQVSSDLIDIQQRVLNIPISSAPDSIHWHKVGEAFSTASAWKVIRRRSNVVPWHDVVWHPTRIPKHAFSLWLALRGAHRTKDKLLAMGVVQDAACVFHCGEIESLQHLFFQCPYSANVWRDILSMCNVVRPILSWSLEVQWMLAHAKGKEFHHTIRKLAFAATIYHLWIERNRRCFRNHFLPYQEIVQLVRKDVCGKLFYGNNSKRCEQHHSLCVNWGIPLGEMM
ncbi:zf-RVT domain-containing protein, partial [Cephalotus follicularis]